MLDPSAFTCLLLIAGASLREGGIGRIESTMFFPGTDSNLSDSGMVDFSVYANFTSSMNAAQNGLTQDQ
jgi:hypothetical protein